MTTTTTEKPALAVGDFVVRSYGYDETHVDFYKVVGHTKSGKSVRLQRWSQVVHSGAGQPCEYVVPGEGPSVREVWNDDYSARIKHTAEVFTKLINRYGGVTIDSYSWATRWDGRPAYQTGFGWGR